MNALISSAMNAHTAAAPVRDPVAALFARVAGFAAELSGRTLARPSAFGQSSQEAYSPGFSLLASQESAEDAADVAEPSMAELLARLAALRENIRRARQRYGYDERDLSQSGEAEFPAAAAGR